MVMCVATDVETPTRKIADYDQHDVFVGGELLETEPGFRFPARTSERAKYFARNGATWIRLAGRKPVDEVRPK